MENRRFTVYARPRSFIFTAPSRADAEMWVEKLQSTVAANRATSTSASRRGSPRKHDSQSSPQNEEVIGPIWEEDCASGGKCRVCERSFNVGVRRHHCRCCGLVACDKCTSGRMHILRLGYALRIVFRASTSHVCAAMAAMSSYCHCCGCSVGMWRPMDFTKDRECAKSARQQ